MANVFNDYFTNATNTHQPNNMNTNRQAHSNLYSVFNKPFTQLNLVPVNAKEIKEIIRSLKWKSSCGYDEVPLRILKISAPYIISPLIYLCNKSMTTGTFPTRLKYSQIVPVYKKGDKQELSNYRPISLLTSFSKIFEKIIYNRLYDHVTRYKILAKEQFGFRNNYSAEKAIYHLINNILKALDNKQLVGGIFCDLAKAFDYVNYDILLTKLEFYGIKGLTHKLITSYLKNRYQRVVIKKNCSNTCYSEWDEVKRGVPQGSVLGPLLFLLYINDLPGTINHICLPTLFADDTNIICTQLNHSTFKEEIEITLQNTNTWFVTNLLNLNFKKTSFVQFSAKHVKHTVNSIASGKNNIINSDGVSFLGLTLDKTLSWKLHIDQLCSKLASACYILRMLSSLLTQQNKKIIYFSYFHSIMTYGVIFWGNSTDRNKVFKLQKRAIRLITNSSNGTSCRGLFKELGVLPLQSQYILSLALFVVNNIEIFTSNTDIHTKNTRNKFNLYQPQTRLTKCQKGVYIAGIKIFNHLPENIKKLSDNTKKFKSELKKFLLLGSFYTIEEFYGWTSESNLYALYT